MKQVFKNRHASGMCEVCGKAPLAASWWVYPHKTDLINKGWWVCEECFTKHREGDEKL